MGGQHMKPLSILSDEKKLDLNNSGTVLLARLIPLKDIKLKKEFQELFPLIPANVEKITMRIKENGYDNSQPVHIWKTSGSHILIDGHHRRVGAIEAGLYEIPCYLHEFSSIDEALEYAISLQTERRNLSDAELLKALKIVDTLKTRGLGAEGEKGKSATRSAQILGISTSRVEKTRTVEKYASDEIKAKIESGELTLNKAYQLVRENLKDASAVKKEKKPSKELVQFLRALQKHLEENKIEELRSLINNELEKAGE
jgi:ParB family chromosome partitioning protein